MGIGNPDKYAFDGLPGVQRTDPDADGSKKEMLRDFTREIIHCLSSRSRRRTFRLLSGVVRKQRLHVQPIG
jgi:hypothetical protein